MPDLQPRLFVIDDEPDVLDVAGRFARHLGFDVSAFEDPARALEALEETPPDAALLDLRMPGLGGLPLLRALKRRSPWSTALIMTGHGSIESAVEAIKLGAADYILKPIDFARLGALLGHIKRDALGRREHAALVAFFEDAGIEGLVGRSASQMALADLVRRVAPHFTTALVTGETGAGKELVARALHRLSPRRDRPFVTVNCSAIVESLFESELFGHVKGAFTGAFESRAGLFERAHDGVIFLDEVGELPLALQAKLLRVLETGETSRVGSPEVRKVDVRVVAATNRVLETEVAQGRFRADLYYRLNVVQLRVPALRDRREDVPLLARAFVEGFSRDARRPLAGLTAAAEERLQAWSWPGNVRELRNVVERACMMADDEWVDEADLQIGVLAGEREEESPVRPIAQIERAEIVRAMRETRGNKKEAARRLGISRRALYRRLEKFGLGQAPAA